MSMIRARRNAGVAFSTFALAGFLLASVSTAWADDTPLTLPGAQRLAVTASEKLVASKFAIDAAQELTVAADQLADPVLQVGAENVPVTGSDSFTLNKDSMTMTRIGVMQEFTRGEKRRLRADRATLSVAMAEAEQAETQVKIERATALAWFDVYFAGRRRQLATDQLREAKAASTAADSAFAQGRKNAADALTERAMVVEAEDLAAETTVKERTARIALARWIGIAADRPLFERPAIDELPLHGHANIAALEAALREHPDIILLDKQLELARTDAALARAERRSDWSMELSYGIRGSQFDDMVSLGVSIPLQFNRGNRQDREVAARLALASAAKAQRDDMYRQHVAEVRGMLDEWNTARQRRERYANDMVPLAKDRVLTTEAAYRGGKATLEDLIAARRNELNVALQVLEREAELARLWAELSFLGTSNPEAPTAVRPNSNAERSLQSVASGISSPSPGWGRGQGEGASSEGTP